MFNLKRWRLRVRLVLIILLGALGQLLATDIQARETVVRLQGKEKQLPYLTVENAKKAFCSSYYGGCPSEGGWIQAGSMVVYTNRKCTGIFYMWPSPVINKYHVDYTVEFPERTIKRYSSTTQPLADVCVLSMYYNTNLPPGEWEN